MCCVVLYDSRRVECHDVVGNQRMRTVAGVDPTATDLSTVGHNRIVHDRLGYLVARHPNRATACSRGIPRNDVVRNQRPGPPTEYTATTVTITVTAAAIRQIALNRIAGEHGDSVVKVDTATTTRGVLRNGVILDGQRRIRDVEPAAVGFRTISERESLNAGRVRDIGDG